MKSSKSLVAAVVLLIVVFVALTVGYQKIFPPKSPYDTITYNNFDFYKIENLWYTDWQKGDTLYTISLRNNPKQVEDIPIVGNLSDDFSRPQVHVAFDPNQGNFSILSLAAGELSLNLFRALKVEPVAACSDENEEICSGRPIVSTNCSENHNLSVIFIRDVGKPVILLEGDCIFLGGQGWDLLKSVDRLLYEWYGIM